MNYYGNLIRKGLNRGMSVSEAESYAQKMVDKKLERVLSSSPVLAQHILTQLSKSFES
jgi:hypothetical protein